MNTKLRFILHAILLIVCALFTSPPGFSQSTELSDPQETVSISTRLVTLTARAEDRSGRAAALPSGSAKVLADGVEQEIAYLDPDQPATVAILFDTSASMRGRKATRAMRALQTLCEAGDSRNRYILFAFSNRVVRLGEFGASEAREMKEALKRQPFDGETALYDAAIDAARQIGAASNVRGKRALVIFTDGVDTESRSSPQEVARGLDQAGGLVYVHILAKPLLFTVPDREWDDGEATRAARVLGSALNARPRVFYYEDSLYKASRSMAADLLDAVQLGFYPSGAAATPGTHAISIRSSDQTLRVVARTSYTID